MCKPPYNFSDSRCELGRVIISRQWSEYRKGDGKSNIMNVLVIPISFAIGPKSQA